MSLYSTVDGHIRCQQKDKHVATLHNAVIKDHWPSTDQNTFFPVFCLSSLPEWVIHIPALSGKLRGCKQTSDSLKFFSQVSSSLFFSLPAGKGSMGTTYHYSNIFWGKNIAPKQRCCGRHKLESLFIWLHQLSCWHITLKDLGWFTFLWQADIHSVI